MRITVQPGYTNTSLYNSASPKTFLCAMLFFFLFIAGFQTGSQASGTKSYFNYGSAENAPLPPGIPDLNHPDTKLTIVVDNSVADNNTNNQIKAHVVDSDGNPVVGANVNFKWNPGTGDVTIGVTTDANGDAFLQLASGIIGQIAITARVGGVLMVNNNPILVTYVAYVPDASVTTTRLDVVTTDALADNSSTNSVKAHITDVNGNPVPNQPVTFQIASGTASFTTPVTVNTDASGNAYISLKSNAVGLVTVTANVGGTPIVNGSPAGVRFVADDPDMTSPTTALSGVTDNSLANGSAANRVKAHITDMYGNPVAGQLVTFHITSGTASPGPLTVTTDANGDAFLSLTSTVVGPVTITADVNAVAIINGSPQTVTFVADAPSVAVSTTFIAVVADGALANNAATNSVKAHITDINGNPVPNQSVTFQIASGTGTFTTPVTVTTDANGEAFVSLKSNTVGTVNITAKVNGTDITNGSPAAVHFVADAADVSSPTTFLAGVTDGALANGVATNSVKAHITDVFGNPVIGQTITFTVASGTATPQTPLTVNTDANGDAVLTLSSTVIGSVVITGTVNGIPIVNGSPQTVVFVIGAPDVVVSTTELEVVVTGVVANGVDVNSVRAHITDAAGHPIANQTVHFSLSGTGVIVGSSDVTTDANGYATITIHSTVAGTVNVTATVNGVNIINGSPAPVLFVAGPPDVTNSLTALVVDADLADADGVATNRVKAHIVDAFGNPVPGQTITFAIASGTATPSGSLTVTTDANGDAFVTLTSTVPGDVTITALLNGSIAIINGSPSTVKFVPFADVTQPATALIVVLDNAFADGTATNTLKAHIVDAQGNPVANQQVVFTITSGDATIVTPQPVTTDANGDAIIFISSTKVGYITVTAIVKNKAIINGSPAKLRFTPQDVWVPRVFTPNSDGTNDVVRPIVTGLFNMRSFIIYNRWGNIVFSTRDVNEGWDGKLRGVMQPNETYIWIIKGTDRNNANVEKRGMISLVK